MEAKVKRLPDGRAEVEFVNGDRYVGELKDNRLTGKGTMWYADGRVYEGAFLNGEWHGKGKATWANGGSFGGYWFHNKRQGFGREIVVNERGEEISEYGGVFKNDILDGEGWMNWPDGSRLTGIFKGFEVIGEATMHYGVNHSEESYRLCSYTGPMVIQNGGYTRQGKGTLMDQDKVVYEGTFQDGLREGLFKVTYPDGKTEKVEFRKDRRVGPQKKDAPPARTTAPAKGTGSLPAKGPARTIEKKPQKAAAVHRTPMKRDDRYLGADLTGNDRYSEELRPYFEDVIGMDEVKAQLDTMYRRIKIDAMRQEALGVSADSSGYYFILTGNPGTGKTTVARIIARMLHDLGFLPSETYIEVDRGDIVGQYIGQTAIRMNEIFESAKGGTLFIDEAYTLYRKGDEKDFGTEAIDTLLKDMEDHRGESCVILAGYQDRMRDMIRNANPGLASRFDYKIHIPDYSAEELVDILVSMADRKRFLIPKEAKSVILSRINREKVDDTFDNARFARRLLDEAVENQAVRLSGDLKDISPEDLQVLQPEDFGGSEEDGSTLEGCLEKLNGLVGLASVKEEVNNFVRAVKIQNESRKRGLAIAANPIPLNMVFTGNPGTGKTTVARLLSQIYFHLGLLKRPDVFVECVRADLVGKYQGETAMKVKDVVHSALGGILFIDEAYSLVAGEGDTFGIEAVNTLVSEIENNRENLAVILAGYSDRMQEFLDSNPGLRSRLPRVVEFPDYTLEELVQIFRSDLSGRGYRVQASEGLLTECMRKASAGKDFGNARGVRNLCDLTITAHNERLNRTDLSALSNEAIVTITDEDIPRQ